MVSSSSFLGIPSLPLFVTPPGRERGGHAHQLHLLFPRPRPQWAGRDVVPAAGAESGEFGGGGAALARWGGSRYVARSAGLAKRRRHLLPTRPPSVDGAGRGRHGLLRRAPGFLLVSIAAADKLTQLPILVQRYQSSSDRDIVQYLKKQAVTHRRSFPPWIFGCSWILAFLYSCKWVVFSPATIPYDSLGPLGTFTRYLVENHKTCLNIGYGIAWLIHVVETVYALKLCWDKGITDRSTQFWWAIQTLLFGITSLSHLLDYDPLKETKHQ